MISVLGILAALGAALGLAIEPSLYVLGMKDTKPPLLAHAIRTFTAGGFSLLLAILVEDFWGQRPFDLVLVGFLIGVSFVGMGLGDWLYFHCLKSTEVSLLVGLISTYPLFVALLATLFNTETITSMVLLASITIVSGVILIRNTTPTDTPPLGGLASRNSNPFWRRKLTTPILGTGIAMSWAITMSGLGISLRYLPPLTINAIRMLAVGSLLFATLFISPAKKSINKPSKTSLVILVIGGVLGLVMASWFMLNAIILLGTARASAIVSVSPFFSALIAMLILKEKPTLTRLVGILLVCVGVLLISIS